MFPVLGNALQSEYLHQVPLEYLDPFSTLVCSCSRGRFANQGLVGVLGVVTGYYRGTLLIRSSTPLGLFSPMEALGGGAVSYEQGTPVVARDQP